MAVNFPLLKLFLVLFQACHAYELRQPVVACSQALVAAFECLDAALAVGTFLVVAENEIFEL